MLPQMLTYGYQHGWVVLLAVADAYGVQLSQQAHALGSGSIGLILCQCPFAELQLFQKSLPPAAG